MVCKVCFSEENNLIQCHNTACFYGICIGCIEVLFRMYKDSNTYPKCININCDWLYYYTNFKRFPKIQDDYNKLIYDLLQSKNAVMINNNKKSLEFIKKCRDDRVNFIEKEFPKIISKVIDICLQEKISRMSKTNKKIIDSIKRTETLNCFNKICDGKLLIEDQRGIGNILVCYNCNNKYCYECHIIYKEGHVCQEENIQGVLWYDTAIKCSECKTPIQKISGCNHVQCLICHTKLDVSNGKRVKFTYETNQAKDHFDIKDTFEDLNKFKSYNSLKKLKPNIYPIESIHRYLLKKEGISKIYLSKMFYEFMYSSYKMKLYYNILEELSKKSNNIDENTIIEYIQEYKKKIKKK